MHAKDTKRKDRHIMDINQESKKLDVKLDLNNQIQHPKKEFEK